MTGQVAKERIADRARRRRKLPLRSRRVFGTASHADETRDTLGFIRIGYKCQSVVFSRSGTLQERSAICVSQLDVQKMY